MLSERNFLEGRIFGEWTVLEKHIKYYKSGNKICYNCRCKCGAEKIVNSCHLLQGVSTQCRICQGKNFRGEKSPCWSGYGEISGMYFSTIRGAAKVRNLIFGITAKDAWELFEKQSKSCTLTGLPLTISQKDYISVKENNLFGTASYNLYGTASLDRIDSNIGYTKDNIQWVHKNINMMKWVLSQKRFIDLCQEIFKWQLSDKITSPLNEDFLLENMGWLKNKKQGPYNYNWIGYKGITGETYKIIKNSAIKRKIPMNLTAEDLWELFLCQNGRCAHSGIKLNLRRYSGDTECTASLDRIDSSKSYEIDNICWSHTDINYMKREFSNMEFYKWCELVSNHQSIVNSSFVIQ